MKEAGKNYGHLVPNRPRERAAQIRQASLVPGYVLIMLSSADPRCVPGGLESQLSEVPLYAWASRDRQFSVQVFSFLFFLRPCLLAPFPSLNVSFLSYFPSLSLSVSYTSTRMTVPVPALMLSLSAK